MFQAAAISVGATISSVALAPAATSSGTAPAAVSMSSKRISDSVVWGPSGTVSNTASADERERPLGADQQARKISSGCRRPRKAHRR